LFAIKELQLESGHTGVNIVFVFEGEEENDSEGFTKAILEHKTWFEGTELILIMNTFWIGDSRPCLIYGLRGVIELEIEVSGPSKDLHTGTR
jgi:acetylornithine deacetylase/succinyl-diaminopimelate desuccinylase-like protein